GTREGRCEVSGYGDCIWLRAYERLQDEGKADRLLQHAPVIQDQGLRGTSAWANFWLRRDHAAKEAANNQHPDKETPNPKLQTPEKPQPPGFKLKTASYPSEEQGEQTKELSSKL